MSNYQINPLIHVGECATCGRVQEDAICEDCTAAMESRNTAILDFYGNLPADLQRAFDLSEGLFDSGHEVEFAHGVYSVWVTWFSGSPIPEFKKLRAPIMTGSLAEAVEWCIENREVLI